MKENNSTMYTQILKITLIQFLNQWVLSLKKLVSSSSLGDSQREEELYEEVDDLHSTGDYTD